MKHSLTLALINLAAITTSASAATVLSTGDLTNPTGSDRGNWHYQSATLSDPDFIVAGDALTPTASLNSVSFVRFTGGTTTGNIFLGVLTDATDLNTLVASSVNSVDVSGSAAGSIMTWNFGSEVITSSTEYFYAFYSDSNSSGGVNAGDTAVTARIWDQTPRVVGTLRNQPSGGISTTGESAYIEINVSSIPEPSSSALLGLAGTILILRRRR